MYVVQENVVYQLRNRACLSADSFFVINMRSFKVVAQRVLLQTENKYHNVYSV